MNLKCLNDLEANCVDRVQCSHWLLENNRDLFSSNLAQSLFVCTDQLFALQLHRARGSSIDRKQAKQTHGRGRLTGSRLTHDCQYFTGPDPKVHPGGCHNPLTIDPEVDGKLTGLNDWLRFQRKPPQLMPEYSHGSFSLAVFQSSGRR